MQYKIFRSIFFLFPALFLAIVIRVYLIYLRKFPSGDEIWAYFLIRNDRGDIWFSALSDFHAPFYFLFLGFLQGIWSGGLDIVGLRFISFLFGFLSIFAVWYLTKILFGKNIALLYLYICLFLPTMVWSSVFGRYYSFLIFLTTVSAFFFIRFIKKAESRYLLMFTFISVLGIYTHYYFFLILLSMFIFLLLTGRGRLLKKFINFQIFTAWASLPLILSFLSLPKPEIAGRHTNDIIKLPAILVTNVTSWEVLLYLFNNENFWISFSYLFGLAVIIVVIAFLALRSLKRDNRIFILSFVLVGPILVLIFAYTLRPLLALSSLQIFVPGLILLLAYGFSKIFSKRRILGIIFVPYLFSSLFLLFKSSYSFSRPQNDFEILFSEFREGDLILHSHIYSYIMGRYYLGESNFGVSKAFSATDYSEKALGYKKIELEKVLTEASRVWFVYPPWDQRYEVVSFKSALDSNFNKTLINKIAVDDRFQENDFEVYLYEK